MIKKDKMKKLVKYLKKTLQGLRIKYKSCTVNRRGM